jgi:hypothetical protein
VNCRFTETSPRDSPPIFNSRIPIRKADACNRRPFVVAAIAERCEIHLAGYSADDMSMPSAVQILKWFDFEVHA